MLSRQSYVLTGNGPLQSAGPIGASSTAVFLSIVALALSCGVAGCGPEGIDGSAGSGSGSGGGGGSGGGTEGVCGVSGPGARVDGETIRFAVGNSLTPGAQSTMCVRWTTPEPIDINGFVGSLGPAAGHHALLIGFEKPTEPDGIAPCSEATLMDAQSYGEFKMLAGVSYESDGVTYQFPSTPVQVGLYVPAGTQLVFDAHFLNPSGDKVDTCATLELFRGKPVVAKLQFRTVLPKEQYSLVVPAMSSVPVTYEEPTGGKFRVVAASSHMHEGGTKFRMSIQPTDVTLFETTDWAEPQPAVFDKTKIVVEENQAFRLDCSFTNPTSNDQHFPDQMCVGGMYLLPCTSPASC